MSKAIQHPIQRNKILGFIRFLNDVKKPFSMRTSLRTDSLRTFKKLGFIRFLTPTQQHNKQITVASCECPGYPKDLSKCISVTPQRHCGFIVPKICIASQTVQIRGTSVTATQTRLQSLYEGMTRQNKAAMPNMSGATYTARVNPLTSYFIGEKSQSSKSIGGTYHA